jgi:hypothetical protein
MKIIDAEDISLSRYKIKISGAVKEMPKIKCASRIENEFDEYIQVDKTVLCLTLELKR